MEASGNGQPEERCGNCRYGAALPDLAKVICKGLPPQIVMLGNRGETATAYPHMPRSTPACALWRPRLIRDLADMTPIPPRFTIRDE